MFNEGSLAHIQGENGNFNVIETTLHLVRLKGLFEGLCNTPNLEMASHNKELLVSDLVQEVTEEIDSRQEVTEEINGSSSERWTISCGVMALTMRFITIILEMDRQLPRRD
ncbi:hypothetical protein HAX54_038829 [Datura stramonium]|uniref:Uncharacterized protein n=1 Tax=Datura stramonium TaxID=4076 RepID=A0ABS8SIC0_DATST|nr:hypothetical protein [Datura stramonium]